MTSTQIKYLAVAAGGIVVIGIASWSYFSKPKTPSLEFNKSAADKNPPVGLSLTADAAAKAKDAPKPSGSTGKGTTPGSAAPLAGAIPKPGTADAPKPDLTRSDTSPPARRSTSETPAVAPPRVADTGTSAPPATPSETGSSKPSSETAATPPSISPARDSAAKPADPPRSPSDLPPIPEATRGAADAPKSDAADKPRVTVPPVDPGADASRSVGGEKLSASGAPRRGEPKPGGRSIRDTEIERGPAGGSPAGGPRVSDGSTVKRDIPAPGTVRDATKDKAGSYTIAQGDTLARIAAAKYGDENLWPAIQKANPGLEEKKLVVGAQIALPTPEAAGAGIAKKDSATKPMAGDLKASSEKAAPSGAAPGNGAKPEKLVATDKAAKSDKAIKPDAPPKADPAAPAAGTHTVAADETLIKIARTQLKDQNRWREIYELNRDKLKNPNSVEVGMVLKLPAATKESGVKKEATPPKKDATPAKKK